MPEYDDDGILNPRDPPTLPPTGQPFEREPGGDTEGGPIGLLRFKRVNPMGRHPRRVRIGTPAPSPAAPPVAPPSTDEDDSIALRRGRRPIHYGETLWQRRERLRKEKLAERKPKGTPFYGGSGGPPVPRAGETATVRRGLGPALLIGGVLWFITR